MTSKKNDTSITHQAAKSFMGAVQAKHWRIAYGRFDENGRLSRSDGKRHQDLTSDEVLHLIPFLRARNAAGASIYIGPMEHDVLYVDDVDATGVSHFIDRNLPVLAVVETSRNSHQVWFPIPAETTAWRLATVLCSLVNGDHKARESGRGMQPRIGRLAGFTNTKPNRRLPSGLYPYVKLKHAAACNPSAEQLAKLMELAHNSDSPAEDGIHTGGRAGPARRKADLRSANILEAALHSRRSETDWHEVRRRLRNGASFLDCVAYLNTHRPEKRGDYARRTVARAATSLGLTGIVPDDAILQRYSETLRISRT